MILDRLYKRFLKRQLIQIPKDISEIRVVVGNSRLIIINQNKSTIAIHRYGSTTIQERLVMIEL